VIAQIYIEMTFNLTTSSIINRVTGNLPICRDQTQPWSKTPDCNYQCSWRPLLAGSVVFEQGWRWTWQEIRYPGTGLGTHLK